MAGPTKRKEKETKFELVKRQFLPGHKRVPQKDAPRYGDKYPRRKGKSTSTKLEKDYQKEAFIDKRVKAVRKRGNTTSKEKLEKTYGRQFERRYQKKGHTGYHTGGRVNTGRENLLEEEGRIDAERMDPNRRAEKRRVIGELNRGFAKGGAPKKQTKQTRQGSAYAKARERKPSGRLNVDDLKRAKGMSPGIGSFTKRRKLLSAGAFKKVGEMMKNLKESRKKLSPHQEAKHSKVRHMMDQPRKKKVVSPHKKQSALEKLMSDAGKHMPKKRKIVKKNLGGSMGGGMNPMGWSPDPTVRSVTGYDGGGKVAGWLATRGYGKARR